MLRYLEIARTLSYESTVKVAKMAAVVVRGGAVLSVGVNRGHRHAEARALKPHRNLVGADIYVMRSNGRISRPCEDCQLLIIEAGIRRAYYIALDGTVVVETFRR